MITRKNAGLQKDEYAFSRLLYIIEAAVEYFISILVTGAYLAKVTEAIGMPDSVTGILTSFVSLGCGFQIVALLFLGKKSVKRTVTVFHILNQLFFALVYIVPVTPFSSTQKGVLLVVFLLLGHIINNVINAPKINWFMSLVDDEKRGTFTANKEIVSLIGGMLFSLAAGKVIDSFEAAGNMQGSFIVCGITLFVLMLGHTLTLVLSKEKPIEISSEQQNMGSALRSLFKDKTLFKVILVSVIWKVAQYATTPFYGTYQIKELGFSLTFVSILSVFYSVCRALSSRPLGKYADKRGFVRMLNICFLIEACGFLLNVFTVPANGKYFYTAYYVLDAIAMGGINSGAINLIYDYVEPNKRTSALALNSTLAGIAGFLSTLAVSPLVSYVQNNGNAFFGLNVYAQQVTSAIGFLLTIGVLVYVNTVVKKCRTIRKEETAKNESKTEDDEVQA